MCRSLAAVKQTGNCVILANPFAFSSPLFPFSFSCSSPLAVTPTLFHQSPSTPLLPRCSMLPLPLQSESSNYALCNPLKINVYGGGRNGNVDPATTPAAVTTLCDLWNQVEREKYERKIERDVTEAFWVASRKKNPFPWSSMENRTRTLQTSGGKFPQGTGGCRKQARACIKFCNRMPFRMWHPLCLLLQKSFFIQAAGERVLYSMMTQLRADVFRKRVVVSGYGVMRTACLVVMAQHQLNSISPIIHLRRIHPWAEEQDELCVTACVCGQ